MSSNLSFFLHPKHVNKAAGRTGGARVKQFVLVFLFPKHVNKAAGRTGCAYATQLVPFAFFHLRSGLPVLERRGACPHFFACLVECLFQCDKIQKSCVCLNFVRRGMMLAWACVFSLACNWGFLSIRCHSRLGRTLATTFKVSLSHHTL